MKKITNNAPNESYERFLIKPPNKSYERFLILLDYVFHYIGIFFLAAIFSLLPVCFILVALGFNIPVKVGFALLMIDIMVIWLLSL